MAFIRTAKSPVTVQSIKDHDLYGVLLQAKGEALPLSDSAILEKLFAAEDFYEDNLKLSWKVTRVFSDVHGRTHGVFPPNAGILTLPADYDELKDLDEPAYDYNRDFWGEERWGYLQLWRRPVRDVTRVVFAYPGTQPVYQVPPEWVRLDRRYGKLQLVPSSGTAIFASFNAYFLGVIAGGRGLPQSIYVDYVTGFTADLIQAQHQHLIEGVRLRTIILLLGMLGIVRLTGLTNDSLSIDGLSRSRGTSGKYGPYSGRIELAIEQEKEYRATWRDSRRGVACVWV